MDTKLTTGGPHHHKVEQEPVQQQLLGQFRDDQRVRRRIQLLPQLWVLEHDLPQLLPIDLACALQHICSHVSCKRFF